MSDWVDRTINHADDLVFVTAVGRLVSNTALTLASVWLCEHVFAGRVGPYAAGAAVAVALGLLASVLVPNALTRHAGDAIVGLFVRPLKWMRVALLPLTKVMHATNALVVRAAGSDAAAEAETIEEEIEQEILSAVEEGEKEGVVDE